MKKINELFPEKKYEVLRDYCKKNKIKDSKQLYEHGIIGLAELKGIGPATFNRIKERIEEDLEIKQEELKISPEKPLDETEEVIRKLTNQPVEEPVDEKPAEEVKNEVDKMENPEVAKECPYKNLIKNHNFLYGVIIVLGILLLASCLSGRPKEDTVKYEYWNHEALEYLSDEDRAYFEEKFGEDTFYYVNTTMFKNAGAKIPFTKLTDINGNEVSLEGKVVLEAVASWCGYSQNFSRDTMDEVIKANPDITFVQVFIDTNDVGMVEAFYENIDKEIPENLKVVVMGNDTEADNWLYDNIDAFPTFLVMNEGTIAYSFAGYMMPEDFAKQIVIADENKVVEMKSKLGNNMHKVALNQKIITEYLNSLTEIEIPNKKIK